MSVHGTVLNAVQDCLGAEFMSLYLVGSHGTPQEIAGSDIDYILVTKSDLQGERLNGLMRVRDELRARLDPEIDFLPRSIDRLVTRGLGLKREGRLVGGEDIRDQIKTPPKEERDEWLTSVAMKFVMELHHADAISSHDLTYPDQADHYFGYPDYASPKPFACLMSLGFLATAWLSKHHDVIVTDKHQIADLYDVHIGSERLPFLRDLFTTIRGELGYRLPASEILRERARNVCQSALHFEKQMLKRLQVNSSAAAGR